MEAERPPVTLPEDCLMGKYARPVMYYCAGWTLHSLPMAQTIAKENQASYQTFAQQQNVGEMEVKECNMPVSLVFKRNT
jgi:hypothetical protein